MNQIIYLFSKHGINNNVLEYEMAILVLEREKETQAEAYKGFIETLDTPKERK